MYWNLTDKDRLLKVILETDNIEQLEKLLKELMTPKEFEAVILRLKAVCYLNDGVTYRTIERYTGLSSKTLAKISKKLLDRKTVTQQILRNFKKEGKKYSE